MDNPNILIKQALAYAIDEINNGVNPTDALKKSAEYCDLNYNYIQRVGEALNTALHYSHFKTAVDKAADFPMANITNVIKSLYDENEKTANHFKSEQFQNTELFNPIPDLDKIYTRPKYKEAYLKVANAPVDEKAPLSAKAVYEKSANYVRELEKQATNANIKKSAAKLNMDASFFNLADGFKKDAAYRTAFEEFESQAFSKHGEKVIPYLDLIYKHANLKEDRGIHDSGYIMFENCSELQKLDNFFKYSEEVIETEKEATDALGNVKFEKEYIAEIYKSAELLKKKSEEEKDASFLTDVFKHINDQLAGEHKKNPGIKNDTVIDNFERQAVLQDLLMRDPVLKKEDHNKVIAAYEQVARLAPSLSKERDVVRAILRQMVAGQALAPHSANQLTEADLNIMKLKAMQQGGFSNIK